MYSDADAIRRGSSARSVDPGLGVRLAGQTTPIRVGVEFVTVDLLAFGPDGGPVPDLRPDELTLSMDGRTREIKSFQYVRVGSTLGAQTDAGLPTLAPLRQ